MEKSSLLTSAPNIAESHFFTMSQATCLTQSPVTSGMQAWSAAEADVRDVDLSA